MRALVFIISILLFNSCSEEKRKESAVKDKAHKVDSVNSNQTEVHFSKTAEYTEMHQCAFSIGIPSDFSLSKMYEDESADFCDYIVETGHEDLKFEIHSLLKSRAETSDVNELYENSTQNSPYDIDEHDLHSNGYFIRGKEKSTGYEVYFLRRVGENFISDVLLVYPSIYHKQVENYIAFLFENFESD